LQPETALNLATVHRVFGSAIFQRERGIAKARILEALHCFAANGPDE
jgi:hypothetical protein